MISRRRMLTVMAGATILPTDGVGAAMAPRQWRGIALGAPARIILDHVNADDLIRRSVNELRRLEHIFSLYDSDSDLSRLNRHGILEQPPFELIELLSLCSAFNARTQGAFDPTVQKMWSLYAQCHAGGKRPDAGQISRVLAMTGWDGVDFSTDRIVYSKPDLAMTLNGVAQGYIADKIAALLRRNGVRNVLVNTGEIAALGTAPDGASWPVTLRRPKDRNVALTDQAIATSAPLGTTFDDDERVGHILDPRTGYPGGKWASVTVISRSAAEADGLSTGFALMSRQQIDDARGANEVHLVNTGSVG